MKVEYREVPYPKKAPQCFIGSLLSGVLPYDVSNSCVTSFRFRGDAALEAQAARKVGSIERCTRHVQERSHSFGEAGWRLADDESNAIIIGIEELRIGEVVPCCVERFHTLLIARRQRKGSLHLNRNPSLRALGGFGNKKYVVSLKVPMPYLEMDLDQLRVSSEWGNASSQEDAQAGCANMLLIDCSGIACRLGAGYQFV